MPIGQGHPAGSLKHNPPPDWPITKKQLETSSQKTSHRISEAGLLLLGRWLSPWCSRRRETSNPALDALDRHTLIEPSHAASRNLALLHQFGYRIMNIRQSNTRCRSNFRIKQLTVFFSSAEKTDEVCNVNPFSK
jgi:hypothetical protein